MIIYLLYLLPTNRCLLANCYIQNIDFLIDTFGIKALFGKKRRFSNPAKYTVSTSGITHSRKASNFSAAYNNIQYWTRSSAIAEKKPIVRRCLESLCSMLTTAIPVRLFTICFNLLTKWHQRLRFNRCGVWGDRVSVRRVESCKTVFLGALHIHLFRRFCCRIMSYNLVTMYSSRDGRTDRR